MATCKRCGRIGSDNEMFIPDPLNEWLCRPCYIDYFRDLEELNHNFCKFDRFCEYCEKDKKEHEIGGLICKECLGFIE